MRAKKQGLAFGRKKDFILEEKPKKIVSARVFYSVFTLLAATNIIALFLLFFSTDIYHLITNKNKEIFAAYENRITQLRIEVDRLYSRQYAQTGNLNLQIIELTQQQAKLAEIQPFVRILAQKAEQLGLGQLDLSDVQNDFPPQTPSTLNNQNKKKDNIVTGSISLSNTNHQQQIKKLRTSISQLTNESQLALKSLSKAANDSTKTIVTELNKIGIVTNISSSDMAAVGGPFIPAKTDDMIDSLGNKANEVIISLERFNEAKKTIRHIPVFMPLSGQYRLSSAYGNRVDPFGRQKAFHSGMDFAAPKGSLVSSAGAGVVVFSGRKGGYGIVVEIKHANGLLTRYAHLSASLVKIGQSINMGEAIAKVGSTGRSTGAHLHFEIRRGDASVNPQDFINVGKQLAKYI